MKNYLGIDYGNKRVGLAIGDDQLKIARPLQILVNDQNLIDRIAAAAAAHQAAGLILGLPRNLDGEDTKYTRLIRAFAAELGSLDLPVELQDEAVTSELAGSSSRTPADDRAAALILQDYLDAL